MIVQWQALLLKLFPVQVSGGYPVFFHGDAIIYGAHQLAQITAYAFFFFDGVSVVWFAILQVDGLVRCVFAGDVAEAAVYAFILVDFCYVVVIDIEVFPVRNFFYRLADEIINGVVAFFIHPVIKAFAEVFDDAETMLHSGRAYLHIGGAEQHKLHRIPPGTYAANT